MMECTCRIGGSVVLGYTPENDAREFRFDIGKWKSAWPNARIEMLVARPGEESTYPAKIRVEGDVVVWTVKRYDTEIPGTGRMWLVFLGKDDEQLGLTPSTMIRVMDGPPNIDGEEPPETEKPWVEDVFDAADRAEKAAERAEEIAEAIAGGGGSIDSGLFLPSVDEDDNGKVLTVVNGKWEAQTPEESGVQFETDATLKLEDGILRVNTADKVEEDNTLPVTSAAVYTEVGNINALLATI